MATKNDGGYDNTFVSDVAEDLTCIMCHLVMREPVLIVDCGHKFCQSCFDGLKEYSIIRGTDLLCPLDRDVIDVNKVYPDKAAKRKILSLVVKCSNHTDGCSWEKELRNVQEHIENECDYEVLKCQYDGCELMTQRRFLADHNLSCYKQNAQTERINKLNAVVMDVCTRMNTCELQLESALKENENLMALKSKMSQLELQLKEKDDRLKTIERRLKENDEMCIKCKLNQEELQNRLDTSEKKILEEFTSIEQNQRKCEDTSAKQGTQIVRNVYSIEAMNRKMIKINGNAAAFKGELEKTDVTNKKRLDKMNRKIDGGKTELKKILKEEVAKIVKTVELSKELKLVGYYQWSVLYSDERLDNAIDSFPFYTMSRYKFSLKARISGINKEHFGVFIVLHPGENDTDLVWPFKMKVTFETVDKFNKKHIHCLGQNVPLEHPFRQNPKEPFRGLGFQTYLSKPEIDNFIINERIVINCYIETT